MATTNSAGSWKMVNAIYTDADGSECAVIANCRNVDTGEKKLAIHTNYERPFWVTKPACRNHSYKKEYELERNLDMYTVPQNEMASRICEIFGERPSPWKTVNKVCASNPYIYGADVSPCMILKKQLADAAGDKSIHDYHVGFLDIESSMLGGNEIILITYVDMKNLKIHTGILSDFSDDDVENIKQLYYDKMSDMENQLTDEAKGILSNLKFELDIRKFDREIDVIRFAFKAIHHHKPDFVGIWNISYDIPQILDRINKLEHDPSSIMCHPEVPHKFRKVIYRPDTNPDKNWADLWHWTEVAGYTQFIDSMALYSILRNSGGREASYSLDHILKKEIGAGKLDLGYLSHQQMQREYFSYYTVYNIYDSLGMGVMEEKNHDVLTMNQLVSDDGLLRNFGNQTVQLKNYTYCYCRRKGQVPAAVGSAKMSVEGDDEIVNVGGNVLSPLQTRNTGVNIVKELNTETGLHMYVCDLDVKS